LCLGVVQMTDDKDGVVEKQPAPEDGFTQVPVLPCSMAASADAWSGDPPRAVPQRIFAQALDRRQALALRVNGKDWSYDRLFGAAVVLAKRLPVGCPIVGVFAARHVSAYIGIAAVMLAGGAYVPLNSSFPVERNRDIIKRSGMTHIIFGANFEATVAEMLTGIDIDRLLVDEDAVSASLMLSRWTPLSPALTDVAYILFTSGSTGVPKGVPISHGNLAAYLDNALSILNPGSEDRFSQTFELTFDLSVHDLFVAWSAGAAVCVAAPADLVDPANYIYREQITQWFSVPSLAYAARQTGKLTKDLFRSVRCSLFCGEALPSDLAREWKRATPTARLENWYGPTEATIACTRYSIENGVGDGLVPIGEPFPGMSTLVIGADGMPVPSGIPGSLHLSGPQVAIGYLADAAETAKAFVSLPGRKERFYDTGDIVVCRDGVLHFLGRRDSQVKIRGYRIDLGEVENALRAQVGGKNVVALAWPYGAINATHILAVVESDAQEALGFDRGALRATLPDYMVPSSVIAFPVFPRNANGKVDRRAIAAMIAAQTRVHDAAQDNSLSAKVLELVLKVKPTLSSTDVATCDNLFLAGMDSLDFVNLTFLLEQECGVVLTQERVSTMASLSFTDLVADLEKGQAAMRTLDRTALERMVQASRLVAFLRTFPAFIRNMTGPVLVAFGSSGTMRAIDTRFGDRLAREWGMPLRLINVGLPALSSTGLARMSRFLVEHLTGREVVAVLHELDPMILSVVPPAGDVELDEAVYSAAKAVRLNFSAATGAESDWIPELQGMLDTSGHQASGPAPFWQRKRDLEIGAVYRGEIGFDSAAVSAWVETSRTLQTLGAPLIGWIHPLAEQQNPGPVFKTMVEQVQKAIGEEIILPAQLTTKPELFLDLNHMAHGEGMARLTSLLLEAVFQRAAHHWKSL
jgi:amino acid adenylation domain-containing protein